MNGMVKVAICVQFFGVAFYENLKQEELIISYLKPWINLLFQDECLYLVKY
jgi:hypothetical protein